VSALFDEVRSGFVVEGRRARLRVDVVASELVVQNVLARVEGRGPNRDELVVVGAHFDHDGIDEAGRIYNGADDDGSGTAAVLEIAEALALAARNGNRPGRSVVVAFWNAEEKGLLGSRYYVANVAPSAGRVVANVNLDMVGRHEDIPTANDPRFGGLPARSAAATRTLVHLLGYTFSPDLADVAREEARRLGLSMQTEYDAHPVNLLRRSDHWPFLVAGVPAVYLTTGLHPDYHTPEDDVDRIDFDKLERIARLAFRLVWRVADAGTAPRFMGTSPAPEP
jgi:Zn-dependent M28 family amino/carboxypeptidase